MAIGWESSLEASGTFVVIALNSESIPESLVWSPTLYEAKDLIEMDEMQRDLGL